MNENPCQFCGDPADDNCDWCGKTCCETCLYELKIPNDKPEFLCPECEPK